VQRLSGRLDKGVRMLSRMIQSAGRLGTEQLESARKNWMLNRITNAFPLYAKVESDLLKQALQDETLGEMPCNEKRASATRRRTHRE